LLFSEFSDNANIWESYLDTYPEEPSDLDERVTVVTHAVPLIHIIADDARLWLDVQLPSSGPSLGAASVTIKGDDITRSEQERWQSIIKKRMEEVQDSEFPTYELISTHLLPLLHVEAPRHTATEPNTKSDNLSSHESSDSAWHHALLTSHHLISPTKRKNLQQWSSQLHIAGFAKVGYPGVIYCEGAREQVEEFVANIKAMQWLALRVRFVEPLPDDLTPQETEKRRWIELEKVGEVVEEMRRLGREAFVVEMGIGSAGQK